ncbi:hypothetical protein MTO96_002411 [Rhipicephalus appendiculatus]
MRVASEGTTPALYSSKQLGYKLQSLCNATQAETSKEEQRQEMLVTEDETMVDVFHGRDQPEEFPRAEIGGDFCDDDCDD